MKSWHVDWERANVNGYAVFCSLANDDVCVDFDADPGTIASRPVDTGLQTRRAER